MSLYEELKRRNVVRVAIAYLAVSWVFLQAVDIVLQNTAASPWVFKVILALMGIGFVLALAVSWAFELTPDGLKRDADVDPAQSNTRKTGRKLTLVIVVFLSLGAGYFAVDRFKPDTSGKTVELSKDRSDPPAENTLAVLPFTNISGEQANEAFTLGIHDDLLTHLTRIKSLKTTSRTSVLQYRNTAMTIPVIATELGVANILEGSIQRAGNRVRINMQLIEAGTDVHLWAEIYDRDLTTENLFDVQADIATAVTQAMRVALLPEEEAALAQIPTQSMAAYDLYLLGRYHMNQVTAESAELARGYFQQAIADDPNYVRALSGLADAYSMMVALGNLPGDKAFPLAQAAIDKAMAQDNTASEVWVSQGIQYQLRSNLPAALESYERAIELDALNSFAWYRKGWALNRLRRFPESLAAFQTAYGLEPMFWPLNARLGRAYSDRGDFVRARQHYARVDQVQDTDPTEWKENIARTFLESGELARAIAEARQVLAFDPKSADAMDILIEATIRLGDLTEAKLWVDRVNVLDSLGEAQLMLNWAQGGFLDAIAFLDDSMARIGMRHPIALRDGIASASYGNLGEAGWAYVDEYLAMMNGWPPVNPADTDQTEHLLITSFILNHAPEQHYGEQWPEYRAMLMQNLDRITSYLAALLAQDFAHPMIYYSLAQAEAMRSNQQIALGHLERAVDQGFLMPWRLKNDPQLNSLRGYLEFNNIQARIDQGIQSQRDLLSELELAPFASAESRSVVTLPREVLENYEGYYTDGNVVAHVYVDDVGRFWGQLGRQAPFSLLATGDREFYVADRSGWLIRFITNEADQVTHLLSTIGGRELRFKPTSPPPPSITLDRQILERYVGTYDGKTISSAKDGTSDVDVWTIRVFVDDEGIVWQDFDNQPDIRIVPYSETEFYVMGYMGVSTFVIDPKTDIATHFIRNQDGRKLRFDRRE